jgi:ATP-dependent zinc metalloprotease ftsH
MEEKKRRIFIPTIIIAVAVIIGILLAMNLLGPKKINYAGSDKSFEQLVKNTAANAENKEKIENILIEGYKLKIRLVGSNGRTYTYYTVVPHRTSLTEDINRWAKEVNSEAPTNGNIKAVEYSNPSRGAALTALISPLITFALLIILYIIFMKKSGAMGSKAMGFGKTKTNVVKDVKTRFSDVAGADEEKEEVAEIVEFLKNPKKFTEIGARIPKGVLLVGPPGTGKTLLARAVAGEANVPFFSMSGSDFVEVFVGVGASRVRDLFDQAKKNMPCIIFIDEIDAVGRQRGTGLGGGNDEREQTLNQLLVNMDGFDSNTNIIVIAATNRADVLDPALLRPGRFDRQVYISLPDVKGREAIIRLHARNKAIDGNVDFRKLARLTAGFSGADIENMLNEAAILVARANRRLITENDIAEAINKVTTGPAKKSRLVTENDKKITAYHESGHAVVGKILDKTANIQEVSIIPRGMAAGYTIVTPNNDDNHVSKTQLMNKITTLLAGRAAEEVFIHDISTGASNDIQRASKIARKMITEWGMSSKLGTIFLGSSEEVFLGRDYQTKTEYSEAMATEIDEEIKKIIDAQYAIALKTIKENEVVIEKMVEILYERETIYSDEIEKLIDEFGKRPEEVVKK